MYPMTNCTYVQLETLPGTGNWETLVNALREGKHFYSLKTGKTIPQVPFSLFESF